jgi:hypothetical protein
MLRDPAEQGTPVTGMAVVAGYLAMRRHTQEARAQLALEAVHDRQDNDQSCHTQRHTRQRDQGNERYESGAALRTQVTKPDKQFNGVDHRLALKHILPKFVSIRDLFHSFAQENKTF